MDLTSMSFSSQNKRRFGLSFVSPVAIFQQTQKLSTRDYSKFAYNFELDSCDIDSHKMCGGNVRVLNEVDNGKSGTHTTSNFGMSLKNATNALFKTGKTFPKREMCNQFPTINFTSLVGGFVGSKSQVGSASKESCQIWDIVICLLDEVMRHSAVHCDTLGVVDTCISLPRHTEESQRNFDENKHIQSDSSNKSENRILDSSDSNKAGIVPFSEEHTSDREFGEISPARNSFSDTMKSYADVAKSVSVVPRADIKLRVDTQPKQSTNSYKKRDFQKNPKTRFSGDKKSNHFKSNHFEMQKKDYYTNNKKSGFTKERFQKSRPSKNIKESYKKNNLNTISEKDFENISEIHYKEVNKYCLKQSCILPGDKFTKSSKQSETLKSEMSQFAMNSQHIFPTSCSEKYCKSYLNISENTRMADQNGESSTSVNNNNTSCSVELKSKTSDTLDSVCNFFQLLPGFHKFQRRCSSECSLDSDDSFIVFDEQFPSDRIEENFMCDDEGDDSSEEAEELDDAFVDNEDYETSFSSTSLCSLDEINEKWHQENSKLPRTEKLPERVSFADSDIVYPMIAWNFAYRAARRGPWEQMARDRSRFQDRVSALGEVLQPILLPEHRCQIWKERISDIT